jgi:hypothetical protein
MEKDRSETLRLEFSLPYGEELKKAARIGLAHAKAQQEPRPKPAPKDEIAALDKATGQAAKP